MSKELSKSNLVEEQVLSKINDYISMGLVLPENFNPANSLKKARLMLNDMQVNNKPVLEVCTKESVMSCLLESVMLGLDYSQGQIYFIPRGNKLTNLESVFGRITRAKRVSKYYKPIVKFVREGDEFIFENDVETGATKIIKHQTKLENIDNDIIAAYTYVTDNDGFTDVFIMSKRQWLQSWKKSSNGASVAKEFAEDMIIRTIIKKSTKNMVKSANNVFTNTNFDDDSDEPLADKQPDFSKLPEPEYSDFEEVENEKNNDIPSNVDTSTGEIIQDDISENKVNDDDDYPDNPF